MENNRAKRNSILFIDRLQIGLGKINVSQKLVGLKLIRLKVKIADELHINKSTAILIKLSLYIYYLNNF
jgi:hypothetical protein